MVLTVIGGNVAEDSLIELPPVCERHGSTPGKYPDTRFDESRGTRPLNIRCMKNSLVVVRWLTQRVNGVRTAR